MFFNIQEIKIFYSTQLILNKFKKKLETNRPISNTD